MENFSVDKAKSSVTLLNFTNSLIIKLKILKFMVDETNELINALYEKKSTIHSDHNSQQIIRKSAKAKYQIFDESEFTRGR